jgi:hypothetical protein
MPRHHHDNHHHGHHQAEHHHHDDGGNHEDVPHWRTGHNHTLPRAAAQWQTPHRADEEHHLASEPDLDKVEAAFVESFFASSDQASFLRLARIPFHAVLSDDSQLQLLRVEIDALTDVGSLTPHLGGESFRYDVLPATLISQRRRLRFVYFDGHGLRALSFTDARSLARDT